MTGPDPLAEGVRRALMARTERAGRSTAEVELRPILNWGGFVNRSFEIAAGMDRYHLKLTSDPKDRRALERWHSLRQVLERRYHAPPMIDWIDVDGTAFSGLLFHWLEGSPPGGLSADLFATLAATLDRLHDDRELAGVLRQWGSPPGSCAEVYRTTIHDRFV